MDARAPLPLHRLHDEEVVRLLESGQRREELTGLLGADGYRELSSLAREAAKARQRRQAIPARHASAEPHPTKGLAA